MNILVHLVVHIVVVGLVRLINVNDEDCSISRLALNLNKVYKDRIQNIIIGFSSRNST